MADSADETRAVLAAYRTVKEASWRDLHPEMASRAKRWPDASEAELRAELEGYLKAAGTTVFVRVGKTPITTAAGQVLGIFGMYQILDEKAAQKIFFERSRGGPSRP